MRLTKQLIYGLSFLLVASLIVWGLYALFFSAPPSCSDGKQNQREEDVDCGGPCIACSFKNVKDVQVRDARAFAAQEGIGVAVEIYNPNTAWAASYFDYEVVVTDEFGKTLETKKGNSFIYAGELKYLVEPYINQQLQKAVAVKMTIKNTQWSTAEDFARPAVEVQNVRTAVNGQLNVTGRAVNQSEFSLGSTQIYALLYNRTGRLVAASKTQIDSLPKFESKDFAIVFAKDLELYEPTPDISSLFTRALVLGDTGEDVGYLQAFLGEAGILNRQPTKYYDEATQFGVATFQRQIGMEPTGAFDDTTRQALIRIISEGIATASSSDVEKTVDQTKTKVFIEVKK